LVTFFVPAKKVTRRKAEAFDQGQKAKSLDGQTFVCQKPRLRWNDGQQKRRAGFGLRRRITR
jgi:hypothetical protein